MDDTKRSNSLFMVAVATLTLLVATAGPGVRAEVSYVSAAKVTELTAQFDSATLKDASALTKREWSCEMYGVRSKLQVHRDLKLYAFSASPPNGGGEEVHSLVNTGDEPISAYQLQNGALEGRGARDVLDQVRMMKDGRLISKMSVPSRGITVAYALCTGS